MSKPYIYKHGNTWRVTIGDHLYASRTTHAGAWRFAENVATYARRIRFGRDLARIQNALARMESNART